ncbi:MAG TPA: hypothetical protein VFA70_08100 [Dehalococcoidia bacterium]|nr:hypothetical protein [Dehalococcoidia bacterium]
MAVYERLAAFMSFPGTRQSFYFKPAASAVIYQWSQKTRVYPVGGPALFSGRQRISSLNC